MSTVWHYCAWHSFGTSVQETRHRDPWEPPALPNTAYSVHVHAVCCAPIADAAQAEDVVAQQQPEAPRARVGVAQHPGEWCQGPFPCRWAFKAGADATLFSCDRTNAHTPVPVADSGEVGWRSCLASPARSIRASHTHASLAPPLTAPGTHRTPAQRHVCAFPLPPHKRSHAER